MVLNEQKHAHHYSIVSSLSSQASLLFFRQYTIIQLSPLLCSRSLHPHKQRSRIYPIILFSESKAKRHLSTSRYTSYVLQTMVKTTHTQTQNCPIPAWVKERETEKGRFLYNVPRDEQVCETNKKAKDGTNIIPPDPRRAENSAKRRPML